MRRNAHGEPGIESFPECYPSIGRLATITMSLQYERCPGRRSFLIPWQVPSPVGRRRIYDKPDAPHHAQQPSCRQTYLKNKYEDQGLSRYLEDQRSEPPYRPSPASMSELETQHHRRSPILLAISDTGTDRHSHSSFRHTNLEQLATKSN